MKRAVFLFAFLAVAVIAGSVGDFEWSSGASGKSHVSAGPHFSSADRSQHRNVENGIRPLQPEAPIALDANGDPRRNS